MNVRVASELPELPSSAAVVVPYFQGEDSSVTPGLSPDQQTILQRMLGRGAHVDRAFTCTLLPGVDATPDALVVGGGDRAAFDSLVATRMAAAAAKYLAPRGYTTLVALYRSLLPPWEAGYAILDGISTGASHVGFRKSEDRPQAVSDVVLVAEAGQDADLRAGARVGQVVGECRDIVRELVNLPPNDINPTTLAERAERLAAQNGLESEVLGEDRMRELGMGSLLGVAAGSDQPPRLIVLRYGNPNAPVKLALVGKGLTFDSGGLSLKTAEGMETMKTDMGGGAAVIGGMMAIGKLNPAGICVTGYVGATENMPGGGAMRPGDILTAMNGKTIEVLNTDAEGRLVLADVLAYAVQQGATHIVDFATLTGAAMVSLGDAATLATGMPIEWVNEVVAAADAGLDRSWPMPQYREYREAMDSDFADLKNTGGRWGGALNAAAFLSEFVGDVPWVHMDIAGTTFSSSDGKPYRPKGATGVGVGVIVSLVRRLTGES